MTQSNGSRHHNHQRLANECAKMDPLEEKALAEEGMRCELSTWPIYDICTECEIVKCIVRVMKYMQYIGLACAIIGAIVFNSHPKVSHPSQPIGALLLFIGLGTFFAAIIVRLVLWRVKQHDNSNSE